MASIILTTEMRLKALNIQSRCFQMESSNQLDIDSIKIINSRADRLETLTQYIGCHIAKLEHLNREKAMEIDRLQEKLKNMEKAFASLPNTKKAGHD